MFVKTKFTNRYSPTLQTQMFQVFLLIFSVGASLLTGSLEITHAASTERQIHSSRVIQSTPSTPFMLLAKKTSDRNDRYQWLFNRNEVQKPTEKPDPKVLNKLDSEILQAGRLYRSGKTEEGVRKYYSAIDLLESAIDNSPTDHPRLNEVSKHFKVFDEMAARVLGPVHMDAGKDVSEFIFRLMEKRRVLTRNLFLKRLNYHQFFDVDEKRLKEESHLLRKLIEFQSQPATRANRQQEEELTSRLKSVRQSLFKSSPRYAVLRKGLAPSLSDVQKKLLKDDEMILDFNLLQDRMIVGIITREKARYYQVGLDRFKVRSKVARLVFELQDRLQEATLGSKSTFLGHAWKEPCRRIYRALLGKMPELPREKSTVFVVPDGPLWYLPFSVMLDPEDRPLGRGRLISLIPSLEMLQYARSALMPPKSRGDRNLLLTESLPLVPEDELSAATRLSTRGRKKGRRLTEHERIVRLILNNPVYTRPSNIVINIQKLFKHFDVSVASTATFQQLQSFVRKRSHEVAILAVPFAVTDRFGPESVSFWIFSPDKKGRRILYARNLFGMPLKSQLLILPISWFDVRDKAASHGEGPFMLSTALLYTGVRTCLMNYSNPNWGEHEPFLMDVLKALSKGVNVRSALMNYPRKIPIDLEASFSGKPPAWAGWILLGDPGI